MVLQGLGLRDFRTDSDEIAGRRMAAAALRSKVDLARFRVSHQRIWQRRVALRWGALISGGRHHAVNVFSDCQNIGVRQGQRRHSAFCARAVNDRQNQLTLLVHQDDGGPKQVRPARDAAAQIHAVAGAAIRDKERLPACNQFRIAGRTLLRWKGRHAASLALAAAAPAGGRGRLRNARWRRLWRPTLRDDMAGNHGECGQHRRGECLRHIHQSPRGSR